MGFYYPQTPAFTVWKDLSIDLVDACLRRRTFATKIARLANREMRNPFALRRAARRYYQFMLLKNHSSPISRNVLVPALDIDLCWHTHQLFPLEYRSWCISHIGRPVDHNDTITSSGLAKGLQHTSLLWLKIYQEGYTTTNLRKQYLTTGRIVAAILFPPYGTYVSCRAYRLTKARIGKIYQHFLTILDPKTWAVAGK